MADSSNNLEREKSETVDEKLYFEVKDGDGSKDDDLQVGSLIHPNYSVMAQKLARELSPAHSQGNDSVMSVSRPHVTFEGEDSKD